MNPNTSLDLEMAIDAAIGYPDEYVRHVFSVLTYANRTVLLY